MGIKNSNVFRGQVGNVNELNCLNVKYKTKQTQRQKTKQNQLICQNNNYIYFNQTVIKT